MGHSIETGTWDPAWEKLFRSVEWAKYPQEHVIRFVARNFYNVPDRSQIRLLELGCGPGMNVWYMAREGFSVSAIDGSPTAIQRAHKRLADEGLTADLRVGDFAQLPWPDAMFDGAVDNGSLCCNPMAAIERALKEIHRVLRPGAPFLSSFNSDRTWGYGKGDMIERDGFINLREGPLMEKGFILFLKRERVPEVFHDLGDLAVESMSTTLDNERHLVEQLIITCRKKES